MPKLVENAGGEFGAGHFNKMYRFRSNSNGSMVLAGRSINWVRQRKGIEVMHDLVHKEARNR